MGKQLPSPTSSQEDDPPPCGLECVRSKPLKRRCGSRGGLSRFYSSKSQSFSSFKDLGQYGQSAAALAKRPSSFDLWRLAHMEGSSGGATGQAGSGAAPMLFALCASPARMAMSPHRPPAAAAAAAAARMAEDIEDQRNDDDEDDCLDEGADYFGDRCPCNDTIFADPSEAVGSPPGSPPSAPSPRCSDSSTLASAAAAAAAQSPFPGAPLSTSAYPYPYPTGQQLLLTGCLYSQLMWLPTAQHAAGSSPPAPAATPVADAAGSHAPGAVASLPGMCAAAAGAPAAWQRQSVPQGCGGAAAAAAPAYAHAHQQQQQQQLDACRPLHGACSVPAPMEVQQGLHAHALAAKHSWPSGGAAQCSTPAAAAASAAAAAGGLGFPALLAMRGSGSGGEADTTTTSSCCGSGMWSDAQGGPGGMALRHTLSGASSSSSSLLSELTQAQAAEAQDSAAVAAHGGGLPFRAVVHNTRAGPTCALPLPAMVRLAPGAEVCPLPGWGVHLAAVHTGYSGGGFAPSAGASPHAPAGGAPAFGCMGTGGMAAVLAARGSSSPVRLRRVNAPRTRPQQAQQAQHAQHVKPSYLWGSTSDLISALTLEEEGGCSGQGRAKVAHTAHRQGVLSSSPRSEQEALLHYCEQRQGAGRSVVAVAVAAGQGAGARKWP